MVMNSRKKSLKFEETVCNEVMTGSLLSQKKSAFSGDEVWRGDLRLPQAECLRIEHANQQY